MAVIVLLALLAGCATPSRSPEPPTPASSMTPVVGAETARAQRVWDLAPRGHGELDVKMQAGKRIAYVLNMTTPLVWDIHSHDATGVQTHARGVGDARSTFTAPSEGTYSIYVQAEAEGARVHLDVSGDFEEVLT